MDLKFNSGQQVVLTLTSGEIYEGEFVCSNNSRIDLIKCSSNCTTEVIKGVQRFYISEISDIRSFDTPNGNKNDDIQEVLNPNAITISPKKYNELKNLSKEYIYMATRDSHYYAAVNNMANCETIGVAVLSSSLDRSSSIDLLIMSTWEQIYIFDLLIYNAKSFPKELSYILENDDIMKVIHDSRSLVDLLYHGTNIKVCNIFDTFVAAHMVSGVGLSLGDCLTEYFHFPQNLLRKALDPLLQAEWNKRPLSDETKELAAQNVQFLIFLRNYLQRKLLAEFYDKVDKHSKSTLTYSSLEAEIALNKLNI